VASPSHQLLLTATMDLDQASSWRKYLGKASALFCLLAFLSILDGLIAKFREPVNVFQVLAGEEVEVNGPLPENIKDTGALTYVSDVRGLALAFETIHSGYFLGGNMWRGRLQTSRGLPPGKYTVSVRPKDYPPEKPGYDLRVVVYPDPWSRQASSRSLIKRYTGSSPYLAAAIFLPLIGATMGLVYLLSRRIESLQAARGLVEIYHVARQEGRYLVAFGLGTRHGVGLGDTVAVLDPEGHYVGTAQVEKSSPGDSVASAILDLDIRPGYFVSRGLPPRGTFT